MEIFGRLQVVIFLGHIDLASTHSMGTAGFIKKAYAVHGDMYGYDRVEYVNNREKVKIYCTVCKDYFTQAAGHHLDGRGCQACANTIRGNKRPGVLYYLSVAGVAYKIGVTTTSVRKRFNKEDRYKIRVLREISYNHSCDAYREEQRILRKYKEFKWYGPALLRSGNTELFNADVLGLDK